MLRGGGDKEEDRRGRKRRNRRNRKFPVDESG